MSFSSACDICEPFAQSLAAIAIGRTRSGSLKELAMIGRFSAFIALFLAASTCAGLAATTPKPMSADQAIAEYKKGNEGIKIFIKGILDGIEWANADISNGGGKKLYCQPPTIALTLEQDFDIMKRFIESHLDMGEYPVGMIVEISLKDTFPCPK